ncbi:purine-cytosine permease FCY21 [Gaeumannomyces tritici R3-111a-1]|uniref:Purine-cytosine permease FCY21 n=1 Tax=Gaeumannomyces tritici (strain R3-111a-1) TaxID=644352 RepID=J3NRU0_GAET3|nr:purine-cytosine permease FCY21 [Gaeumannomyces tritici R3-111a-1]EJT78896.1 purine-cytosine permease FCY21 [Gaeumannomyces tritici R3-111a-1]
MAATDRADRHGAPGEKTLTTGTGASRGSDSELGYVGPENAVHGAELAAGQSWYARAQRYVGRFGVEQRGVERVPTDERSDSDMSHIGSLWLSANMTVSTFAIGVLARPVFGLGFVDAALTIILINILGIMPVCFFATFGPRFGLRQMMLSRFFFGFQGVRFIAIFNILACLGWSSVNVIVGSQLLHAVNPDFPSWAGILTIALCTLVITTFGYRIVHVYEKFSWIPVFAILLIVAGLFGRSGSFDGQLAALADTPADHAGAVLGFAASVFGFATGWASLAADYTVYQPADRSRPVVFAWTFVGLIIPLCFNELLGAAVMTASATDPALADAYQHAHVGGVLAHVLVPPLGRFGQFCMVVLALSIVANNCPNIYSVSLTLQVTAPRSQRVPRFVWAVVATCAYVAISIPGYDNFEAWLENFMVIIGYWLAVYEGVALTEHFVFRRGFAGYDPEDYTEPDRLPPGCAGLAAFACGVLGAAVGMNQVWFTGPVGRLAGGAGGGDVGFELAFSFSSLSYVFLRAIEKRRFGR